VEKKWLATGEHDCTLAHHSQPSHQTHQHS
jgi:hypothetical protein